MGKEWDARPDELPELHVPQMPLAACAILYSYEGICLILPIVSIPVFCTAVLLGPRLQQVT